MSKRINPAQKFINNHSSIIFFVVVTLGIAVIILLCYQTYYNATNPDDADIVSSTPTSFDEETEKKVKSLHTRDDSNYENS